MIIRRWVAVLLIGAGSVLAAAGPAALAMSLNTLWMSAGWVLAVVTALSLLFAIAPRGTLAGPLTLAGVSVALLAWRLEWWRSDTTWSVVGLAAIVAGGVLVFRSRTESESIDPVLTCVGVIFPRLFRMPGAARPPSAMHVVSIGARVRIELESTEPPRFDVIELMLFCWGGRVEIVTPAGYNIVAGRVETTHGMSFEGTLDSPDQFPHPREPPYARQLAELPMKPHQERNISVVIHAGGVGGHVVLVGR